MLAPLSSLPDNVEALKLARLCINRELGALLSCVQHRRNLATSIHKLPIEVMIMIFAAYTEFSSLTDIPCLLHLMTVNKLWYDIIVHSPHLWTVLESDFTPKILNLVLQRSKNLPLSLIWDSAGCEERESKELKEVLEVVSQNSIRLESIKMVVAEQWKLNHDTRRLLESNMPHLKKLEVKSIRDSRDSGERLDKFMLSDGPSLREIALATTSLSSWSSPRLIGLFALDLTRPCQPPSIQEFWNILSNSPQIERLRLCELDRSFSPWTHPQIEPITLPHLKEIFLKNLDGPYLSAMLTSVYAPSSSNVHISSNIFGDSSATVLEAVFSPANIQLEALLGLKDPGSLLPEASIPITIVFKPCKVRIVKSGEAEDREMMLDFGEVLSSSDIALLGRFFQALPQAPAINLEIETVPPKKENAVACLLPWSRSLRGLSVHHPVVCRSILKQLAEQTENSTTGIMGWVCPNLNSIQLSYLYHGAEVPELDGAALESLVLARWSGRADGQSLKFAIRCREERYPSIWSRVETLKQIIPRLSIDNR